MSASPPADGAVPAPAAPAAAEGAARPGRSLLSGWSPLVPLGLVVLALGLVIFIPSLYSDPNGLDPYTLRASGASLALLGVVLAVPRLAPSRLVVLGIATVALSWSAFLGAPTVLGDLGVRQTGDQANLDASVAWFGVTAVILGIVWLVVRRDRPRLRLRSFGPAALGISLAGLVLFFLVVMLVPASLLGREGLPFVALARDAPWLVPANLLQGLAQELQFRGLLLGSLEKLTTPFRANLVQAVIFGLAHLAIVYQGPIAPFVPFTMVLGFLLGLATQRTRSLWPAIVIHGVADVAATLGVLPGLYGY